MAGFVAGLVHVLSGPDHLAAVAPLSVGKGKRGWQVGFKWGLGHCGGVLLIGLLALAFREMLPLDAISSWAERIVGATLMGVGAWGICKAMVPQLATDSRPRLRDGDGGGVAVTFGALHGLAGSSHLLGVVPGLVFPGRAEVCAYLIAFGGGTLAGMMGFSSMIALAPGRVYRSAMAGCSGAAAAVGCYWLFV